VHAKPGVMKREGQGEGRTTYRDPEMRGQDVVSGDDVPPGWRGGREGGRGGRGGGRE
jgi:hypothetical protein